MRKLKIVYPEGYKPPKGVAAMVNTFVDTVTSIFQSEGVPVAEIQFEGFKENKDPDRYAASVSKDCLHDAFVTNIRTTIGAIRDGYDLEGVTRHEVRHMQRRDPECYYALSVLSTAVGRCKQLKKLYDNEPGSKRKNRFESSVLRIYGTPTNFLYDLKKIEESISDVSKHWNIFSATDKEMKARFAKDPDFQIKLTDILLSASQQVDLRLSRLARLQELVKNGGPKTNRKLTPAQCTVMDDSVKILEKVGPEQEKWKEFVRVYRHSAEYECDRYAQATERTQGSMLDFLHFIQRGEEKIQNKASVGAQAAEDAIPAAGVEAVEDEEDTHPETAHRIAALKRLARQQSRVR